MTTLDYMSGDDGKKRESWDTLKAHWKQMAADRREALHPFLDSVIGKIRKVVTLGDGQKYLPDTTESNMNHGHDLDAKGVRFGMHPW